MTDILDLIGGKLTDEQVNSLLDILNSEGKNVEINSDGTFETKIGHTYVVASSTDEVLITNANDAPLCELTPAGQVGFVANTTTCKSSTLNCTVTEVFRSAAFIQLSGGGLNINGLPAGYLQAEYLESTGSQYIKVALPITPNTRVVACAAIRNKTNEHAVFSITPDSFPSNGYGLLPTGGSTYPFTFAFNSSGQIYKDLNLVENTPYIFEVDGHKMHFNGTDYPFPSEPEKTLDFFVLFGSTRRNGNTIYGTRSVIYSFEYLDNAKLKLTPVVDSHGRPCMYDNVSKKPFYNSATGQFIVGMTMKQAHELGKLPAGTTLTISLPVGYDSDAEVVAALSEAEANSCMLTVQTYEVDASAASTFSIRRIWVRKRADENGTYIAGDGTRWQVEWCVTMYTPDNSTPDQHGYEQFRSVEAACEYWELEPYIDPTLEKEINNSQT